MGNPFRITAAISLAMILLIPASAGAASLSVGGSLWYAWWQPAWADNESVGSETVDWEVPPSYMLGPIISLGLFDRLVLSAVGMKGTYNAESSLNSGTSDSWEREISKFDFDFTVLYRINGIFSIFLGLKHQEYSFTETHTVAGNPSQGTSEFRGNGPGLGTSVTLPVADSVFLVYNLSLLYTWNNYSQKLDSILGSSQSSAQITGYGFNTSLSAAWYLPSISTTVSAGIRYQQIKFKQGSVEGAGFNYDGLQDRFFGFTLAAMYTFNFS